MEFEFKRICPAGVYQGIYDGCEDYQSGDPERDSAYKEAVKWRFTVSAGEFKNSAIGRITPKVPTSKNATGRIIRGLCGSGNPHDPSKVFDDTPYIGNRYQIIVEDTDSGYTRVASCIPVQDVETQSAALRAAEQQAAIERAAEQQRAAAVTPAPAKDEIPF
ncbi:MAG TPA: hypothetical protein DCF94_04910 [Gammaproteobacteria bacterium]|nr:hypothetical protein [Gammaproteobacteria bacterium]|tara:strand:+ start:833 stop:1318 length:486 start_codon:yes stop_codon:yes gene_type:complete